ncbi:Bardet-Biedl syndrome 1 protein, partial [Cladochytrium tenue]
MEVLQETIRLQQRAGREAHERIWLDSLYMPLAEARAFDQGVALCGPDDTGAAHDLVVADLGSPGEDGRGASPWWPMGTRLKFLRGNQLLRELLVPLPLTAVAAVFPGDTDGEVANGVPDVVVVSGPQILVYRDGAERARLALPDVAPDALEAVVWGELGTEAQRSAAEESRGGGGAAVGMNVEVVALAVKRLSERSCTTHARLATRSLRLLALGRDRTETSESCEPFGANEAQVAFCRAVATTPLRVEPIATSLATLDRSVGSSKTSCLVLGSEELFVYIVSPPNYTILEKFQLSSPIAFVAARGNYDTDYDIVAACRDNAIYRLRNNTCKQLLQLQVPACGLVITGDLAVIGGMNSKIVSYSLDGAFRFSLKLPARISVVAPFVHEDFVGFMVGLHNKEVRIYNGPTLINAIKLQVMYLTLWQQAPSLKATPPRLDTHMPFQLHAYAMVPRALRFGRFGREPRSLVAVLAGGGVAVKILRRHACLDVPVAPDPLTRVWSGDAAGGVTAGPTTQAAPDVWIPPVPKKTKVYLDIITVEQKNAYQLRRQFLEDYALLRQVVDEAHGALVKATPVDNVTAVALDAGRSSDPALASLSVEVMLRGLGPVYEVAVRYQNHSDMAARGVVVSVTAYAGACDIAPHILT